MTDEVKKPDDAKLPPEMLLMQRLDQIATENVWWVWDEKIPWAMLTMFAGMGGVGKSTAACDVIARYTTGRAMPNTHIVDENEPEPHDGGRFQGEVAILVGEESVGAATKPRLLAAGADVSKVHVINCIVANNAKKTERMFSFDRGMEALEASLDANPNISLIVIDPISTYLGAGKKTDSADDVRQILTPLVHLCARRGVTAILIHHFNKQVTQSAVHRLAGTQVWSALCRSIWMFAENPDQPGDYAMKWVKGNYCTDKTGVCYRIETANVEDGLVKAKTSKIVWQGASEGSADDLLEKVASKSDDNRGGRAVKWLLEYMTSDKPSAQIISDGKAAGHTRQALFEAKKTLDMNAYKRGLNEWFWKKPAAKSSSGSGLLLVPFPTHKTDLTDDDGSNGAY